MRTFSTIISLVFLSSYLMYAQVNLNSSIIEFEAKCANPISPGDSIPEFTLVNMHVSGDSTLLNFSVIANCAQQKRGQVNVSGDTLLITETDVTIATETHIETDSLGNILEVTTETKSEDYAFCDCLINFSYIFSAPLGNINILKFHEKVFELK
jgi:hypothetical protein